MKVESFSFGLLSHNELHRLCGEMNSTFNEFSSDDPLLAEIHADIQSRSDEYRQLLDRESGSSLTREVRQADDDRDDAFRALKAGIEFAEQHFEPQTREAGQHLSQLVEQYGHGMLEAGYGEQTTLADALLAVLAEREHAAAVTAAGLEPFVVRFQEKEAKFKELVRRRQETEAADEPSLRETRNALQEDLNVTRAILNFWSRTKSESVQATIRSLNERIQEITTPAKARHTRQETEATVAPTEATSA